MTVLTERVAQIKIYDDVIIELVDDFFCWFTTQLKGKSGRGYINILCEYLLSSNKVQGSVKSLIILLSQSIFH